MKLTPLDIRRKEFKRSLRGYAGQEVDVFLDEVADEFERVFREHAEMRDRLQPLEEQLESQAQMKAAIEKTLVTAQVQADQVLANARKESELIMRAAELKARDIARESYSETQRVQQALVQLKHLEEEFRFKFRSLLEAHLNLLSETPIATHGPEVGTLAADVTVGPSDHTAPEAQANAQANEVTVEEDTTRQDESPPMVSGATALSAVDDDTPTEEVVAPDTETAGVSSVPETPDTDEVVAEESLPVDDALADSSLGHPTDDLDDTFVTSETVAKEEDRTITW
ncbi:MAG: DivIVA domain-containing protein [Thermoleophilia bacterium]|jgi:cell division initiation protein